MSDDPHSPTTAAPTPQATSTVAVVAASSEHPPGTPADAPPELTFGIPADRPEILVGAAFAGGLVAAIILKRLGGD